MATATVDTQLGLLYQLVDRLLTEASVEGPHRQSQENVLRRCASSLPPELRSPATRLGSRAWWC